MKEKVSFPLIMGHDPIIRQWRRMGCDETAGKNHITAAENGSYENVVKVKDRYIITKSLK
jgi:hypothetical protein